MRGFGKNRHLHLFFGKIGQENVFNDILERKNAFLRCKNKKFKESKNRHYSKRVSLWFCSKFGRFSTFSFLGIVGQENVFYDILEGKSTFLGYKNKKFKKSKNWHFSKGGYSMVLVQNWQFLHLFFWHYMPGKCVLWYSRMKKKRLSRL